MPITRIRHRRVMPELEVENFGPIKDASVAFGDLTVLVGPQATGKSILLQLLKLQIDLRHIKHEFKRADIDWDGDFLKFLDVYFGEGMRSLWKKGKTRVAFNKREADLAKEVESTKARKDEKMFFIPAQRVLA